MDKEDRFLLSMSWMPYNMTPHEQQPCWGICVCEWDKNKVHFHTVLIQFSSVNVKCCMSEFWDVCRQNAMPQLLSILGLQLLIINISFPSHLISNGTQINAFLFHFQKELLWQDVVMSCDHSCWQWTWYGQEWFSCSLTGHDATAGHFNYKALIKRHYFLTDQLMWQNLHLHLVALCLVLSPIN